MVDFVAWHSKTLLEHTTLCDTAEDYRFLSLSVYGSPAQPFYAAVMIRRPVLVARRDWPQLSAAQFQQTFDDEASRGFGPVIIAASGPASNPLFAAVFEAGPDTGSARYAALFITIQHLLEHTSGLNPDDFANGVAMRDAFHAAFQPATLPVSAEMTDSFIASLSLISDPGSTQVYSNCGYYLIGRVVAKLRNTARPIDAYQQYLFAPLSITRIRRARSLLADQAAHEARYQNPDLIVYASQMSQEQPLLPAVYGSPQLEILEGSGGLTGAATDIARLIAIVMSQQDGLALTRATNSIAVGQFASSEENRTKRVSQAAGETGWNSTCS